jgi:hypothetical protein
MDESALERARQRLAEARDTPPLEAALGHAKAQLEELAAVAAELESSLPGRVEAALQDGLRDQVLPVARHVSEIRGLMTQAIRRLERLEADVAAERQARVDDLALLVDLVSSGWSSVDERLGRLERPESPAPVVPLAEAG